MASASGWGRASTRRGTFGKGEKRFGVGPLFGASGLAMLRALVAGESDPVALAALARGALRKKAAELVWALEGALDEHHRFLLGVQLGRLDRLEEDVRAVEARIDVLLAPYRAEHARRQQIPGVSAVTATVLLAELGPDMHAFGSDRQLATWVGICPGNDESAGKRRSGRVSKGNAMLKTALVEAAHAAATAKGTYFKDKFRRLQARRGYKRATLALGHKILRCAYHMLRDGTEYRELGEGYLDVLDKRKTAQRLRKRLEKMGFEVELKPKAA